MGGFECSTHLNGARKRIDVIAATRHDEFAAQDYRRLSEIGMLTARDGARWHLIEQTPGAYDFSSVAAQVRAARETGVQIIWDLFHYGFPNDLDILSPEFVERFARFAGKFTEFLLQEKIGTPYLCLVNEISFFAWIAGDVGAWHPYLHHHAGELKGQLIKAAVRAAAVVKRVAPHAVLIQTDPIINVVPSEDTQQNRIDVRSVYNGQFEALDMILGRIAPELGGAPNLIDVIGVNFYSDNQWRHPSGERVWRGNPDYKPLSEMLTDFYARYRIPLFVAETGIEDEARPEWFRYVCEEVKIAVEKGVPVLGVCLYPIVNHPGWDDDRHCRNGLWCYADETGEREIYRPLADEIAAQILSAKRAGA